MNETADKIYMNARIYTMDRDRSVKEVLTVKQRKILYCGTLEEALGHCGEKTQRIDLKGKTVFPAFVESHLHTPGAGYIALYNVNLYNALTEEETLDEVRAFIAKHPEKREYYGRGFNPGFFSGEEAVRGPRKEKLDAICPDKPVILTDYGGHMLWMNSKALQVHEITEETEAPAGGIIEKDPGTGKLWGTLKDYATKLIPYQSFTLEEKVEALKWMQNKLHAYGYTSIFGLRPPGSMAVKETLFDGLAEMEKRGELKLRVNGARDMDPSGEIQPQVEALKELKEKYDSKLIRVTTAKYFGDGVVEGGTGCLLAPYEPSAGKQEGDCGEFLWDVEKLGASFQAVMEAGFRIHMHTVGDGAVHYALDALAQAFSRISAGPSEMEAARNCLTHLELADPGDIKRMADMKVIAAVQPYWHIKSPSIWESLEKPAIGLRAEREFPYKSFLDAGVRVTASSDHPVTQEPNPFHGIQAGVTRNLFDAKAYGLAPLTDMDDPKWLMWKEERVGVMDVIESFTIQGAYALGREGEIGSLEAGKDADLIVVSQDPFTVHPLELENIEILETVFQGETVYRKA